MQTVDAAIKYLGNDPEAKELVKAVKQARSSKDPNKLHELSKHPHRRVHDAVAENEKTAHNTLTRMTDYSVAAARRVAESDETTQARLHKLASHPDESVRDKVAANSKRRDTLHQLAHDPSVNVRQSVAENEKTHPETHQLLADDPEFIVRYGVAVTTKNHKLLHKMAKRRGEDQEVRYAIADSEYAHQDTLDHLAKDPDRYVRRAVRDNPRTRESTRRSIKLK